MPPPHDDCLFRRYISIHDFIPSYHGFTFRSYYIGNPTNKIIFETFFFRKVMVFDKLLKLRARKPYLIAKTHLIPTYMNVRRRKQPNHFIQHITYKLISFFIAWVVRKVLPSSISATCQFRIRTTSSRSMARHINFRQYHDLSFISISNDFLNIFLSIECRSSFRIMPITHSTLLSQFRVFLDFDSPDCFVRQMPMEYIQMQGSHNIQILFHFLFPEEMATFVQHESSP